MKTKFETMEQYAGASQGASDGMSTKHETMSEYVAVAEVEQSASMVEQG